MEFLIFIALCWIAAEMPTEDQLNEVIRLLKEDREEKTPPTNTPNAGTAAKLKNWRRKR